MLFDLRGRGRRRTVQAIYLALAILMGGGLVLFGIGGGGAVSGGLVDAITGSSGGGDTGTERFLKNERAALKRTDANPQDAAAWAALARARVQTAGVGENFDPGTSTYTAAGKAKLQSASAAWDKYLELDPKNKDDRVASLMVRAYDPTALNQPAEAARAQEIITETRPKAATFAQLAYYAYLAGDVRKGDLARQRALDLSDPAEKNTLKSQLDQAKQQAQVNQPQNQATPTPTKTPSKKKDSK